ncbi:MAG: hypothetical protein QF460_01645 [Candidatus Nanoarchaeia archaeon]|jgi:hypothetical protein|nr:hypothetical protein [Candidatus Nanoarchaeia archaeon]|tara:strand:+ start:12184 stop:13338 length:1155 start_codon:yes stop_codon:yes gene_type:complete
MKRLLLILLLLPAAFAAADYIAYDQVTLGEGESIEVAGRNITLLDVFSNTQVRISVEDTWKIFNENETKSINKVNITVNATLYVSEQKTNYASLLIHVLQRLECNVDSDCNDQLDSTIDTCMESINKCSYETIVSCTDNDGYCPSFCSRYSDSDCVIQDTCELDKECDDSNPGTKDSCEGSYNQRSICRHDPVTECKSGDDFCPLGCKNQQSLFGTTHDADCSINNSCIQHSDCNDDNDATIDLCSGDGTIERACTNELTVECSAGDNYCPAGCSAEEDWDCFVSEPATFETVSSQTEICNEDGMIVNNTFCQDGVWKYQKAGSSSCNEDYQCQTGVCKEDNSCLSDKEITDQRKTLITSMIIAGFLALTGTYLFYLFRIKNKL